jgi:hypothetical protein
VACSDNSNNSSKGSVSAAPPGSTSAKCEHLPAPEHAGATVAMAVESDSGGMLPTVEACIGKSGPYSFVVDTGSSRSIIDSNLASTLQLAAAGPVAVGGSGCATTGTMVHVPALRIGSIAVAAQPMLSTSLQDWSGVAVDGVLGSDVLGRFGAVDLDLTKHTLSVGGTEGPAPSSHQLVVGKGAVPPPTALYAGTPTGQATLTVVRAPGTISAFVNTTVAGHGPAALVVDTGSPTSSLDPTLGFTDLIPDSGTGQAPGGIGCSGTVKTLKATPVSFGSLSQTIPALRAVPVEGALRTGVGGNLGLDALGSYGAIVVDYQGATLTVGPG